MSQIRSFLGQWLQSFFVRLTLAMLGIFILIGILSNVYLWNTVQTSYMETLVSRASNLASELSITGSELFAHNDLVAIQRVINRIFDQNNLKAILVVDRAGRVLSEKDKGDSSSAIVSGNAILSPYSADIQLALASGNPSTSQNSETFTIIEPIYDSDSLAAGKKTVIGAVFLQMLLEPVAERRAKYLTQNGFLTIFLLLALVGIDAPLIFFLIFRKLKKVTDAAQRIAAGQFDTRLPTNGAQEFKLIAASFNKMAADLQADQVESQKRLSEVSLLYDISTEISKSLVLDEMLGALANQMARLVDGTGAFIVLWDDAAQKPIPFAAYGSFDLQYKSINIWSDEPTLTAKVLETGAPIAVEDVLNSPYISPRIAVQFPVKSLLGLPLVTNNQKIGAILIAETRCKRVFTDHEIQLAMSAAGQIAATIVNVRLYEEGESERNRLNDIINSVSDAIIVSDTRSKVLFTNQAFSQVTGWDIHGLAGHSAWDIFTFNGEELGWLRSDLVAAIRRGELWQHELTGRRPDGSTYDADVNISAIRNASHQIVGYVGCVRDISNFKELDRMKTRFVSTVSHELRTPLTIINLNAENLLEYYDRLDDSQRQGLIRDIHTETNTLHQLIEDLLSLSRLDSGRAVTRWTHFNLGESLTEAVNSFNSLASKKGVTINCRLPDQPVPVYADRDQLGEVFRNLLGNAVKFTPGTGTVSLECEVIRQQVIIQVSDTGIGIPTSDLPHLFERFFRSKLSIEMEIPGTGLGLAITREILERNKGSIEVQSEVGKGSMFRVSLPLEAPLLEALSK